MGEFLTVQTLYFYLRNLHVKQYPGEENIKALHYYGLTARELLGKYLVI